jgi:hypothetical protein
MNQFPITKITLFKHGVGYFTRKSTFSGESITLKFKKEQMDDILKSLTLIERGTGKVLGVDYDTPEDRDKRLKGSTIVMRDEERYIWDLLKGLKGRKVKLYYADGKEEVGLFVGFDRDNIKPMELSRVYVLKDGEKTVTITQIDKINAFDILDENSLSDLKFFLETTATNESHRSIQVRLTSGEHDLEMSYITAAPLWRVSYRLVMMEPSQPTTTQENISSSLSNGILQGWGIFDNSIEEDLKGVSLSLVAGKPISFIYELYKSNTPERPVLKEEMKSLVGPVEFEGGGKSRNTIPTSDDIVAALGQKASKPSAPMQFPSLHTSGNLSQDDIDALLGGVAYSGDEIEETVASQPTPANYSVESQTSGKELGELFQYTIGNPVSVDRGKSAMVPILNSAQEFNRELIYNGNKLKHHPLSIVRFYNKTGLTLEKGPVTIIDNGEYVGEGLLPFTPNEAEAIISFAVDLGTIIKESQRVETSLFSINIKQGYFLENIYEIQSTKYTIENKSPNEKMIYIEHNLLAGYEVFDTIEASELKVDFHRYRLDVKASETVTLIVKERKLIQKREALGSISYDNFSKFFNDKFLDNETFEQIKIYFEKQNSITQMEKIYADLENRKNQITKTQEQIRKNISTLSTTGDESKHRVTFVNQLMANEKATTKLDTEILAQKREIENAKKELNAILQSITV